MVSPFTLGLFAPLPLAMMIPFMATQSLAMGEAFGKSFQYGKRKISSLSNEEFNKLTLAGLMDEQTANIKSIIPKLTEQMHDSKDMQVAIFQEMTKLIPAFLEALNVNAEAPDKIFAPTQDTANQINTASDPFEGLNAFFKAISQKIIVGTQIPSAYADDTTTDTPTFTQADQDKQDNFTTNLPITLTSLTDAELRQAYSQRNNGIYTSKERQQLVTEYKKRFGQTPITNVITKNITTDTSGTPQGEYDNIKFQHLKDIQELKFYAQDPTNTGHIRTLAKRRLQLRNHITRGRNVTATKAQANNDWNARLWLK